MGLALVSHSCALGGASSYFYTDILTVKNKKITIITGTKGCVHDPFLVGALNYNWDDFYRTPSFHPGVRLSWRPPPWWFSGSRGAWVPPDQLRQIQHQEVPLLLRLWLQTPGGRLPFKDGHWDQRNESKCTVVKKIPAPQNHPSDSEGYHK